LNPKVDKETAAKLEKYKRDNTAMPDYYKAWDKLASNIDEEDDDEDVKPGQITREKEKQLS
jgi:hypothetical protein